MKRFIMLAMVLVMMVVSIGGCWIGREGDDRGGRGGGDRGGEHERGGEHDRGGGHEERR